LGLRVWGVGFRVQDLGIQGVEVWALGLGCLVWSLEFGGGYKLKLEFKGSGFRVQGSGFRV
jgi:hypothetical protein